MITMATPEKKKIQQAVYLAGYASNGTAEDAKDAVRELHVIAPHFQRAAFKAVKNTKDGETLVSLQKQNDAVV